MKTVKTVGWMVGLLVAVSGLLSGCQRNRPVAAAELKGPVALTQFSGVAQDYDVLIRCWRYQLEDGEEYWRYDYRLDYRLANRLGESKLFPDPVCRPARRIHATAEWTATNWTSIYVEGYLYLCSGWNGYRYNRYGRDYGPSQVWDPCAADAGIAPYTAGQMATVWLVLDNARFAVMDDRHQDQP